MEQQQRSVGLGIGAGVAVGIAGAIVWAIITNALDTRIGYLALAVGAGVGFAVGKLGKGPENGPLPIIAGVIALVSVVVGDTFGWATSRSADFKSELGVDISALDLVKGAIQGTLDFQGEELPVRELYKEDFSFFVLIMLAFGVFAAYSLARRELAKAELPTAPGFPPPTPYEQPGGAPQYGPPAGDAAQPPYGQAPDGPPSFEKRPPV